LLSFDYFADRILNRKEFYGENECVTLDQKGERYLEKRLWSTVCELKCWFYGSWHWIRLSIRWTEAKRV